MTMLKGMEKNYIYKKEKISNDGRKYENSKEKKWHFSFI